MIGPLVVPMDPAYFPEAALIIAGAFTGVAAVRFLILHESAKAARAALATLACIALVVVFAITLHGSPKPKPTASAPKSSTP